MPAMLAKFYSVKVAFDWPVFALTLVVAIVVAILIIRYSSHRRQ
jgi:hypothetical protein